MNPVKVFIVDDSAVVRLGIRKMLLTDPDTQDSFGAVRQHMDGVVAGMAFRPQRHLGFLSRAPS
ncbi:hypothetical protein WCLP8_1880002 [uncultured Gammaproteobacteria bacterium]